jgi:pimeloyl-ACP methyl ester carboxylesterase
MKHKATYVLVHGAWQGASTWEATANRLRASGHPVFTPTLTGLGDRSHQLTPEVDLEAHIKDVLTCLSYDGLRDVVLVGHSYGGMVITGVTERAEGRVAKLVYVDAFVPEDGDSALSLLPPPFQQAFRDQAQTQGDGWRLPASDRQLDLWGLKPGPAREFVRSKLCDFSLRCFEQPIRLPAGRTTSLDRTYIACVAPGYPARPAFAPFAEKAKREGWRYHELPAGHDCQVELPDELAAILLSLA